MRWSFETDRKVFIFTHSRRSPLQGAFRWSFPRPEGLGCFVKRFAAEDRGLRFRLRTPEGPYRLAGCRCSIVWIAVVRKRAALSLRTNVNSIRPPQNKCPGLNA